jgi:hypothetical protein
VNTSGENSTTNMTTSFKSVSTSVYTYNLFIFIVGFALPLTVIISTSTAILRFVKQVRKTTVHITYTSYR